MVALPEIIQSVKRSVKVVSSLMMTEAPIAVVGIVFKTNQLTGDISLIGLCSPTLSRPVVFDVYRNPKLYLEGELHRIFQAEKLIKVVHDCKRFSSQLKKKYYITCNAMFDTQVAYTLQMEENELPPRLISYENLHKNIVGFELGQLYSYVKGLEQSDGNLWNKRPISDEMMYALSEEVISLRSEVYPNILRCALAARGSRVTGQIPASKRPPTKPPVMRISPRQAKLLPKTQPMSQENS